MNKGEQILLTFQKLRDQRECLEPFWSKAYKYTYPHRGIKFITRSNNVFQNTNVSRKLKSEILDTTGTESTRIFSTAVLNSLTPSYTKWFELVIPNKEEKQIPKEVLTWLEQSGNEMYRAIHNSNYDSISLDFFKDITIAGMAGIYIEIQDNELYFEEFPLQDLYVQSSLSKEFIDTVYRTVSFTAKESEKRFGINNLPDEIKDILKDKESTDFTKEFPFIHAIRPRVKKNGKQSKGKFNRNLPFESIYVCQTSKKVVYESGYHEFPVIIPRLDVIPGTDYSLGLVDEAIPDIATACTVRKLILDNAEMQIAGTYVAKHDGVFNARTVKIGPKRIIAVSDTNNIKPLQSSGDFNLAFSELDSLQKSIRRIMLTNFLTPLEKANATATEILQINNLVRQQLGPILSRFQSEFLNAFLQRVFGLMFRNGMLPRVPDNLQGQDFTVEYTSPMQRAQNETELQAINAFEQNISAVAGVKPDVLDVYDFDKAQKKKADLLNVPESLINDDKTIEDKRLERVKNAGSTGSV